MGRTPLLNKVLCCDALTLLRALRNDSIDCIVTSPPYNLGTSTNGAHGSSTRSTNWWSSALLSDGYENHDDSMPHDEYVAWQRQILTESLRVSKAVFYNTKWRVQGGLLDMRNDIMEGFPVRQVIIWSRGASHNHNNSFFNPRFEVIYFLTPSPTYRLIQQYSSDYGDVWNIKAETNSDHPAPFPVEIPLRCIQATGAKTVLDPFVGSGSTVVAAKRLGINYIGCDRSATYVKMSIDRLNKPIPVPMFAA